MHPNKYTLQTFLLLDKYTNISTSISYPHYIDIMAKILREGLMMFKRLLKK